MKISSDRSESLVWRGALAGFCSSLVGIGLARFAYTALIPALISEHWYSHSEAVYLGAANLAGYLVGALFGRVKARWIHTAWILRLMMLLTAVSMFACALRDFGFAWAALWRFVSGYTGVRSWFWPPPRFLPSRPLSGADSSAVRFSPASAWASSSPER
ncbi:MAG: YbfB/YjiJ family MFS transporter [Alphaproteobacteria bacterium]